MGITDWATAIGNHGSDTRVVPPSTESTRTPAPASTTKNASTHASPSRTTALRAVPERRSTRVGMPMCPLCNAASAAP